MKTATLLSLIFTLTVSINVHASETQSGKHFVADSQSQMSALCLAALESEQAVLDKARQLKISRRQAARVTCNDMRITDFARNHSNYDIDASTIATVQ
tara:strand:- start:1314 stop:1607 length:294 start_codon:yes stop_codon:yes gene_type:complete